MLFIDVWLVILRWFAPLLLEQYYMAMQIPSQVIISSIAALNIILQLLTLWRRPLDITEFIIQLSNNTVTADWMNWTPTMLRWTAASIQ